MSIYATGGFDLEVIFARTISYIIKIHNKLETDELLSDGKIVRDK